MVTRYPPAGEERTDSGRCRMLQPVVRELATGEHSGARGAQHRPCRAVRHFVGDSASSGSDDGTWIATFRRIARHRRGVLPSCLAQGSGREPKHRHLRGDVVLHTLRMRALFLISMHDIDACLFPSVPPPWMLRSSPTTRQSEAWTRTVNSHVYRCCAETPAIVSEAVRTSAEWRIAADDSTPRCRRCAGSGWIRHRASTAWHPPDVEALGTCGACGGCGTVRRKQVAVPGGGDIDGLP